MNILSKKSFLFAAALVAVAVAVGFANPTLAADKQKKLNTNTNVFGCTAAAHLFCYGNEASSPYESVFLINSADGTNWDTRVLPYGDEIPVDMVHFKKNIYVAFDDGRIIKYADDGTTGRRELIESYEPLYNQKIQSLFVFQKKLYAYAVEPYTDNTFTNLDLYVSEDEGENWTKIDSSGSINEYLDASGWIYTQDFAVTDSNMYVLLTKDNHKDFALLYSTDGNNWQLVSDDKQYLHFRKFGQNIQLHTFKNKVYLHVASKHGSGVRTYRVKPHSVKRIKTTGLKAARSMYAVTSNKSTVYSIGMKPENGKKVEYIYSTTNMRDWKELYSLNDLKKTSTITDIGSIFTVYNNFLYIASPAGNLYKFPTH